MNHKGELKQGISPNYEYDVSGQVASLRVLANTNKQKDIKNHDVKKNKTFSFKGLVKDLAQNKTRKKQKIMTPIESQNVRSTSVYNIMNTKPETKSSKETSTTLNKETSINSVLIVSLFKISSLILGNLSSAT